MVPSTYTISRPPHILIKVHINERPRWKRTLFLERICVDLKGSIIMEGYVILFLALTSPLWFWIFLPHACMLAWKWVNARMDTAGDRMVVLTLLTAMQRGDDGVGFGGGSR